MSSDINSVVIVGRLTRDPELKVVGSTSVCRMSIANNYSVKVGEEYQDKPNFFDVEVWGRRGETVAQYLSKGRQVAIRGSLRWRQWEAQDGSKRSAVSIAADEVQFIGPREDTQPRQEIRPGPPVPDALREAHKMAAETFADAGLADDDIPF